MAGSYTLMTFTSGVLLKQIREEPENQSKLLIGEGDSAKLTKGCRQVVFCCFIAHHFRIEDFSYSDK